MGKSTDDICRQLVRAHNLCQRWAQTYGAKFAQEKYELMHFTRRRRYNLEACVEIEDKVIQPSKVMRVLGIWLDPALRWKGHLNGLAGKLKSQVRALTCLTTSTWGVPLVHVRMVYNMVIRPAVSYGSLAWHQPRTRHGARTLEGPVRKLAPKQNECLRRVAVAYRATPVSTLETETFTEPLDLHIDRKVARAAQRIEESDLGRQIGSRHLRQFGAGSCAGDRMYEGRSPLRSIPPLSSRAGPIPGR